MAESDLERWLKKKLKAEGCLCFKFTSPGTAGVPDRIIVTPNGRVIFVELKDERGVLSNIQKSVIRKMRLHRCDVRILRGRKEMEEFINEIRSARLSEKSDTENNRTG